MPSLNFNKNKYYVLKRNIIVLIRNDWKYIDKNCLYSINSIGQIRNNKTNKLLSLHKNKYGYIIAGLKINNKYKSFSVHRLVAKLFINNPNPKEFNVVNHINENKSDNRAENLEWCTQSYNHNYGNALNKQAKSHGVPVVAIKDNNIIIAGSGIILAKYLNTKTVIANAIRFKQKCKGYIIKYATTKQAMILGNKEIVVTIIN